MTNKKTHYIDLWVVLIVLMIAICSCSYWCTWTAATAGPDNSSLLVPMIHLQTILCTIFAVLLVPILKHNLLDRLNDLHFHALQRLRGENALLLTGNDLMASTDAVNQALSCQRDEAILREHVIADYATEVICSLDQEMKFIVVGPTSEALWGYPHQSLLNSALADVLEDTTLDMTYNLFHRTRSSRQPTEFENQIRHAGGSTLDMQWSIEWSETDKAYFCVAHDITERKQLERMKEQFFAMITHDIKVPLTAVCLTLDTLTKRDFDKLSNDSRDAVKAASNAVKRMVRLTSDLLDFEQVRAGNFSVEVQRCNLKELLNGAAADLLPAAAAKRIQIECHVNDGLSISCDPDRLHQVIVNLLSNAIKFSPEGTSVIVTAVSSDEYIQVSIKDHGPGIPPSQQEHIFEPFKQVSGSRDRRHGGIGLGLAICRSIVQAHKGTLKVHSTPGNGSIFSLRLPVAITDVISAGKVHRENADAAGEGM